MSNITGYFAAERYLRRRFLLLGLGVLIIIPAALALSEGLLSPRQLGLVMIGYVGCVAVAVSIMLRGARARFQVSSGKNAEIADGAIRNKFRKQIRRMQIGVAFFSFIFVFALWETRGQPWPPRVIGAAMNLLIQYGMIQSIRRMQRQLKEDTSDQHQ